MFYCQIYAIFTINLLCILEAHICENVVEVWRKDHTCPIFISVEFKCSRGVKVIHILCSSNSIPESLWLLYTIFKHEFDLICILVHFVYVYIWICFYNWCIIHVNDSINKRTPKNRALKSLVYKGRQLVDIKHYNIWQSDAKLTVWLVLPIRKRLYSAGTWGYDPLYIFILFWNTRDYPI